MEPERGYLGTSSCSRYVSYCPLSPITEGAVDPEKVNIRVIVDNFAAAIWGERDLFQLGIGNQEGGVLLQTVNEADRQGRIVSVDALNSRDQGGIIGNGFLLHSPCLVVAEIVVAGVEDDGIKQNGADNGSQTGPERGRELCMLCQQDSEYTSNSVMTKMKLAQSGNRSSKKAKRSLDAPASFGKAAAAIRRIRRISTR